MLFIITFTVLPGAWGEAQSLGDIARHERARQRDAQSRITITNESVNYSIPVSVSQTDSKTQPLSPEEPPDIVQEPSIISSLVINEPSIPEIQPPVRLPLIAEDGPVVAPLVPPVRDEGWWRRALQEARDILKRAEDQVISLQVALSRARLDQLEATPNERVRLAAEIARLTKEIDSAQRDVVNSRRGISDLEEDFRQSARIPAQSR